MYSRFSIVIVGALLLSTQLLMAQAPGNKKRPQAPRTGSAAMQQPAPAKPQKLSNTTVAPGIDVKLPANFEKLTEDAIADRYPSWKKPVAVYSDPAGTADFIVTIRRSDFPPSDMELLQQFYKASILNMFSEVEFLGERIQTINDRQFLTMEFLSTMTNQDEQLKNFRPLRKYTYIGYTIDDTDNKMTVFTLQVPAENRKAWQELAPQVLESVKMKKAKQDPKELEKTRPSTYK